MGSRAWLSVLLLPMAGCASNVLDTDLLVSNTFFLPPTSANTVFIQNRNASDNQQVTLSDLEHRLSTKGYRVVTDHQAARFLLFTNIVYCNQTKPDLPVEVIVSGGYGSSIGGSILSGLGDLAGMAGSLAAMHPAGAAAGMAAQGVTSMLSSVGGMFGRTRGPSVEYKQPEGLVYACVTDVQITDQSKVGSEPAPVAAPGSPPPPGVYQTRIGASVYQRKVDLEEATPMMQQRLSAAVAGYF